MTKPVWERLREEDLHDEALAHEPVENHADWCRCDDCEEERYVGLRQEVPLRVPEHLCRSRDEDDYRIGEGTFDAHFFHVERIEHANPEIL